jgi:uncharacterized protein
MSLFNQINEDIKAAMLSREKDKLETLRSIKAAFLVAKTEKGGNHELTEDAELKIVQKLLKQRKDSAEIYHQQKRDDLYQKEMFEASVLEKYLPAPMTEEELVKELKVIIDQTGAKTVAEIGKVMAVASKQLAGKADGKIIAGKAKELLGG